MSHTIAVLGATGLVGREMLAVLEAREFPVGRLLPLASARSAGGHVDFAGERVEVLLATPDAFEGVDIVLASAGSATSSSLLPEAARRGAVSIDNSSCFRMDPDVPLVVPEVNPHRIRDHQKKGIIANPNCSTIQLVAVLKPLHDAAVLRRVHVSTYQSVSGAGHAAMSELLETTRAELAGEHPTNRVFKTPIAFNVIPEIDVFTGDGSTREERKMRDETRKILEADIAVDAFCVRVPVMRGHSEAVWIETERPLAPEEARELLRHAPGLQVVDDPSGRIYPTARDIAGQDHVMVGRIRRDPTHPHGLALWIVADNLRKGAATNAVQIAEILTRT